MSAPPSTWKALPDSELAVRVLDMSRPPVTTTDAVNELARLDPLTCNAKDVTVLALRFPESCREFAVTDALAVRPTRTFAIWLYSVKGSIGDKLDLMFSVFTYQYFNSMAELWIRSHGRISDNSDCHARRLPRFCSFSWF